MAASAPQWSLDSPAAADDRAAAAAAVRAAVADVDSKNFVSQAAAAFLPTAAAGRAAATATEAIDLLDDEDHMQQGAPAVSDEAWDAACRSASAPEAATAEEETPIRTPTQGRKRASPPPIRDILGKKAAIQPPATPPATVASNPAPILGKKAAIRDILGNKAAIQPPAPSATVACKAVEEVDLPAADPIAMPNWSDFTELHANAMHNMFSADRGGAELVNSIRALAKEAAGLTNRLATETDADFLHLTQTRLDKAHSKLAEKITEFEKEPSCELHNTFCDFSKKFGGPAFDLDFAVFDGPV
ncbi:TPA: hypothetical protein ACH3X1_000172 [Trebouxia sp. C0004]